MAKKTSDTPATDAQHSDAEEIRDETTHQADIGEEPDADDSAKFEDEITVEDAEVIDEAASEPEPEPEPENTFRNQAPQQGSSAAPLILAGIVSAAIGVAGAYYLLEQRFQSFTESTTGEQSAVVTRIADLEAALTRVQAEQEQMDIPGSIAAANADFMARLSTLEERVESELSAIDTRLATLERRPNADGSISEAAQAAYEEEIAALRTQIVEQRAGMEALVDEFSGRLEETRAEAAAIEEDTTRRAQNAAGRAALARVQAAIDAGTGYASVLADLQDALGAPLSEALTTPANRGVAPLSALQESFPDVARAALAASRRAGDSGEDENSFIGFLKSQFDVRSVAPREGADADAVLSRAEAALQAGRLTDTLAELALLPPSARAEMTGWIARAEARQNAVDAVNDLSLSLNEP